LIVAAVIGLTTPRTVAAQKRRSAHVWWVSYAGVLGLTICVAGLGYLTAPAPLSLGVLVLFVLLAAVVARPELGLWFIAFFGVAGDPITVQWYPFAKTMSTPQSMLYVSNAAIVYPNELLVAAALLGWILRMAATRRWELHRGALFRPMMTFGFFLFVGLVVGLARGGNPTVALWEVRPLLLLVAIYVVATNLVRTPAAFRRLWSALMAGVFVDAVFAIVYYNGLPAVSRAQADHLGDHSAALHANAFFILMAAMGVMAARSTRRLVLMLLVTPIVGYAYILAERRAAFVGLVMAMVMLEVMLYHRRRRAFLYTAPLLALVFGGYLLAFWNVDKGAGFPAQAVKTVIAPGQLSEDDKGSDLYRSIENYNVVFTIRTQPLTGIGFGQQYLRPIPNADITFAQWWEYRSHNAVLWIWMKTGLGGFLAMLYLFTAAIRHGTRRLMRVLPSYDGALLLTSVLFVVMFAVFAYVDIVWDTESMIFLGIAFAGIASDILGEPRGETAPSGPKSRWGRSFGRPGARLRF
jgi:hypothetical protein